MTRRPVRKRRRTKRLRRPTTTRRTGPAIDQHRPVRSCIGCRTRRPAHELVRITRSTTCGDATFVVDGASNGRGAWLCRSTDGRASLACFDAAAGTKQFARAWRTQLDPKDIEAMRREIDDSPTHE